MNKQQSLLKFTLTAVLVLALGIGGGIPLISWDGTAVAQQRRIRPNEIREAVYQILPNFPRENEYISRETGKAATENTLVSRMIRYHTFIKSRPPNFRLDWKLTLADYLGANEVMYESTYPGGDTLQQNPLEGDKAAIQRLTRTQRNTLVDVLVSLYSPNAPKPPASVNPAPSNSGPVSPKPGDARLLMP